MNSVKKEDDEVQKLYDNMKRNLVETANIATDTLCILNDQGNKIERINNEMDTVDKKVDKSYKLVNKMSFMKSIFGYLTLKKTKLDKTKIEKEDYIPSLKNELTINNKNDKENELDEMLILTKQLSIMSNEMNSEISIQNEKLDHIDRKVENTNNNIRKLNKRIKKL